MRRQEAIKLATWTQAALHKLKLPYTIAFSGFNDGALPFPWQGSATLAVSGGQAVNAPTLGSELLTNGNMETGDPPSGWIPISTTVIDGVADERTGGAGAQSADLSAPDYAYPKMREALGSLSVGEYVRIDVWAKNVDASHGVNIGLSSLSVSDIAQCSTLNLASWTRLVHSGCKTGGASYVEFGGIALTYNKHVRFDDASVKKYTAAELVKAIRTNRSLVTVKATITADQYCDGIGIDCCLDDPYDPQNFVRATLARVDNTVRLVKFVNGTPSNLITPTVRTYVAGAALEIRHPSANTFQLFYNDVQVGTDQTVSDASIINNTFHGLAIFKTEGAGGVDAFFLS